MSKPKRKYKTVLLPGCFPDLVKKLERVEAKARKIQAQRNLLETEFEDIRSKMGGYYKDAWVKYCEAMGKNPNYTFADTICQPVQNNQRDI